MTARGSNGFGSTGETITSQHIVTQTPPVTSDPKPESHTSPQPIPFTPDELDKPTLHSFTDRIGDLWLSNDPFGPTLTMEIDVKGSHSTLGLQLDDNNMIGRLYLRHCEKSTPSARMSKWRTNLRNSSPIRINNQPVKSINEVKRLIAQARTDNIPKLQFTFATDERVSIHPEHGVPQLYFDQLNTLTAYLQEMKYDEQFIDLETNEPVINLISKKRKSNAQYTRAELKKREDWPDWVASEFKQLDLYEMQNMFGLPVPRPKDANIINLLWAYSIKTDGTKKSRCVCNGSPKRKGTVTLAHTFAACLEQPGARTFWAVAALLGLIIIGADASNAFAEAPAPKAPLYVVVDQQYREWWKSKGRGDIPLGYVLPVKHALQGHPESPRLWATMIDTIIREKANLQPCTHEPCLYSGYVDGKKVLFLRQVDDFAVACEDPDVSNKVIDLISAELSAPMKKLGVVSRYNGIDVTQTEDYIKIHNSTYIKKILETHEWLQEPCKMPNNPIPMNNDTSYITLLETSKGPEPPLQKFQLENEMGFSYRQAIGELMFAMVTCRPDISYPVLKLSTFSNDPSKEHYQAVKQVMRYLRATINDGIIYWRQQPRKHMMLLSSTPPTLFHQQNPNPPRPKQNPSTLIGSVDSDWASDHTTRKSISGIVMYLAGGGNPLQNTTTRKSGVELV